MKDKAEKEDNILRVKLAICVKEAEKFIDELETLCKKFAIEKDYFFNFK